MRHFWISSTLDSSSRFSCHVNAGIGPGPGLWSLHLLSRSSGCHLLSTGSSACLQQPVAVMSENKSYSQQNNGWNLSTENSPTIARMKVMIVGFDWIISTFFLGDVIWGHHYSPKYNTIPTLQGNLKLIQAFLEAKDWQELNVKTSVLINTKSACMNSWLIYCICIHLHFIYCKQTLKHMSMLFGRGNIKWHHIRGPSCLRPSLLCMWNYYSKMKGPKSSKLIQKQFFFDHVLTIMVFISFHVDVIWGSVQVVDVSLSRQRLQRSPFWTTHLQEGLSCWARKLTTPGMDEKEDMQQVPWCFGC